MSEPAYVRIASELRARIQSGAYPASTRMPSIRGLASQRGVSDIVIRHAYRLLLEEGLVEGRVGSGYYVSGDAPRKPSWIPERVWRDTIAKAGREGLTVADAVVAALERYTADG